MESVRPHKYVPFADAVKVKKLDSHTYSVELDESFCAHRVPNGGYVASCLLKAANAHVETLYDQPDNTVAAHFEFPSKMSPGPAIISIEDIKVGGGLLSTLQLTLWQNDLQPRAPWVSPHMSQRKVLAYTTHADIQAQEGLSIPTAYEAAHSAAPSHDSPDFPSLCATGKDTAWQETLLPAALKSSIRSLGNLRFFLPQSDPIIPGFLDMWIRTASGEPMTQAMLPYIVDSFPFNLYEYIISPDVRRIFLGPRLDGAHTAKQARGDGGSEESSATPRATLWLPTISMNLETKTPLPTDGVEWLTVRVTSKQIQLGRFDLEVIVRDVEGQLIMLSHHVALMLDLKGSEAKPEPRSNASGKHLL
ncbi:thioesterase family protein [Astrocystis sublimbata]|nr:thioesterase family protein [Astrocystis sublimbata]